MCPAFLRQDTSVGDNQAQSVSFSLCFQLSHDILGSRQSVLYCGDMFRLIKQGDELK